MAIIVSRRIREREFGAIIPADDVEVLQRSARVALATAIASKGLPPGTRLLKAYATSRHGPRRVVYMLAVGAGDLFLLFYRGKNDAVGANISPQNPAFRDQLKKYLAILREDIQANDVEFLAVSPP
jgi:hypothetical protein